MNILKKSLSVVLSVLMFVSVCSCLMSTTVSATADLGVVTTYEFDKDVFASKYTLYTGAGAWGLIDKEFGPNGGSFDATTLTATPDNTVNRIPFLYAADATGAFDGLVKFEAGKTYRLEVDFTYDATAGATMLCVGFTRTRTAEETGNNLGEVYGEYAGADFKSGSYELVTVTDNNKTGTAHGEIVYTATDKDAGRYLLLRLTSIGSSTITLNGAKLTVLGDGATFTNDTARSIRAEGTVAGEYQSAGLRFRATLNRALVEGKDEIGFIVIPTSKIAAGEKWYEVKADGTLTNSAAKMIGGCRTNIYGQTFGENPTVSFQLIVAGLTRDGETKNLKDTEFTAVLFTQVGTEYTYYYVNTTSYTDVKDAYAAKGYVADDNGLAF